VCGAWGQGNSKLEEEVGEMLKVEKRSRELIAHPNGGTKVFSFMATMAARLGKMSPKLRRRGGSEREGGDEVFLA